MRPRDENVLSDPTLVWKLAAKMIDEQPVVPKSPAEQSYGRINLCAAACLAKAGLHLYASPEEAAEFEENVEITRSFALVGATFDRFNWDRRICNSALQFNDSQAPESRKDSVLRLFASGGRDWQRTDG